MDFKPDLTPKQMFEMGVFGGTYFRPIYSSVTKKNYKNQHKEFDFLTDIDENLLTRSECDISLNKYSVKVGTSLEFWEMNGWIIEQDPYGWVQWYCRYYAGRRSSDDERQIKRWKGINSRFGNRLRSMIKMGKDSLKIRQTLLHWGIFIKSI